MPHTHKQQSQIQVLSAQTKNVERYAEMVHLKHNSDANNVPCCEIQGQLASGPVAQVKTKVQVRQRRLFEEIERYVYSERFVNLLVYSPRKEIQMDHEKLDLGQLWFESRFESGNLAEAFLARDFE